MPARLSPGADGEAGGLNAVQKLLTAVRHGNRIVGSGRTSTGASTAWRSRTSVRQWAE